MKSTTNIALFFLLQVVNSHASLEEKQQHPAIREVGGISRRVKGMGMMGMMGKGKGYEYEYEYEYDEEYVYDEDYDYDDAYYEYYGKGKGMMDKKGKKMGMMGKAMGRGRGKGKGKGKGKGFRPFKPPVPRATGQPTQLATQAPIAPTASMAPVAAPVAPPTAPTAPTVAGTPGPTFDTEPPTAAPSQGGNFPTVVLDPYELLYTIDQFRFVLPSEYDEVALLTDTYLDDFFAASFANNDLVTVFSSETILTDTTFSFGEPVGIQYETTVVFTQNSFVPSNNELNTLLAEAFTGQNLQAYQIFLLEQLPSTNLFDTTTEIFFRQVVAAAIKEESIAEQVMAAAGVGVVSALGAFLLLVLALNVYDRREVDREYYESAKDVSDGHMTVAGDTYEGSSAENSSTMDSSQWENESQRTEQQKNRRSASTHTWRNDTPSGGNEEMEDVRLT